MEPKDMILKTNTGGTTYGLWIMMQDQKIHPKQFGGVDPNR